jgi:integrase/recombinase XerC
MIDQFLAHLKRLNRSEHTRNSYQRDLKQFSDFFLQNFVQNSQSWYGSERSQALLNEEVRQRLEASELKEAPWASISPQAIQDFLSQRLLEGTSASTLSRQLSALRSFYQYLLEQKQTQHNPVIGLKAPKQPKPLPKSIPVDMAQQLLDTLPEKAAKRWQAVRDQAMFELLYSSGLRVAELAGLDLSPGLDDLASGWIKVTKGKGNKSRIVPVGETARQALERWLAIRAEHALAEEGAVFVNPQGKRLSIRGIQKALDKRAELTGVPTKMSPHRLRHACATHLLESSGDLRAVQEMLGHANLSTTQIYTKLDLQHLAQVYDEAHPRAKRSKQSK